MLLKADHSLDREKIQKALKIFSEVLLKFICLQLAQTFLKCFKKTMEPGRFRFK